jgi:hypothetical protein
MMAAGFPGITFENPPNTNTQEWNDERIEFPFATAAPILDTAFKNHLLVARTT